MALHNLVLNCSSTVPTWCHSRAHLMLSSLSTNAWELLLLGDPLLGETGVHSTERSVHFTRARCLLTMDIRTLSVLEHTHPLLHALELVKLALLFSESVSRSGRLSLILDGLSLLLLLLETATLAELKTASFLKRPLLDLRLLDFREVLWL